MIYKSNNAKTISSEEVTKLINVAVMLIVGAIAIWIISFMLHKDITTDAKNAIAEPERYTVVQFPDGKWYKENEHSDSRVILIPVNGVLIPSRSSSNASKLTVVNAESLTEITYDGNYVTIRYDATNPSEAYIERIRTSSGLIFSNRNEYILHLPLLDEEES